MTASKGMRAYWDALDRQCFDLRQQGLTWQQIGDMTGRSHQGAQQGAKRWRARQQTMEAAE